SEVVPTLSGGIPADLKSRVSLGSLLDIPASEEILLPDIFPEDIALCFCTSGSTGKPKVVICSHYGVLNWTKQCEVGQCFTKDTVFFGERPFGWAGGSPRPYVTVGCTHVFVDTRMTLSGKYVSHVCDIIDKEKVSVAYIPRYVAMDLLNNTQLASKCKTLIYMLTFYAIIVTAQRYVL
ncbi:MAG: AMP-binding protein, partial [Candidatus Thiodiazotropha sp.]